MGFFLFLAIILSGNILIVSAQNAETQSNETVLSNVNFFKADLVNILQQLASESGYNLITTPEVNGTITLKLSNVTFEELLKIVCRSRGLIYLKEGHNYFVGARGQSFVDQKIIGYFHIYYADPDQMVDLIKKVVGNQDVYCDARTRTVVINSSKDVIDKTSNIIESIDRKMPQITIEVKVIEVSTTALRNLAQQWKIDNSSWNWGATTSGAQLIIGMIGSGHSWSLIFNDLVSNGKAHLLTSPSVSTVDGKEASILIGDKIPVVTTTTNNNVSVTNVSYIDVGVKLNFTPKVQKDDELNIDLKTEINSLGDLNDRGYYDIKAREVNSSIQAKIDQTVFLGGLITKSDRDNLAKVPGLSSIPLLGKMFQSSEKSSDENELIVTITPRWNDAVSIINDAAPNDTK